MWVRTRVCRMNFGLAFANIGPFVEPDEAITLAQAAEAAGFESIWTVDHVVVPAGYQSKYPYDPSGKLPSGEATVFPDPLIWLAYVAARTSIIAPGHRHPHRAAAQPARAGQGAGHARPSLGRPDDPWRRHRLAGGGVRGLGSPLRRAWTAHRRGHCRDAGPSGRRNQASYDRQHDDLSRLLPAAAASRRNHSRARRGSQQGSRTASRPHRRRVLPVRRRPRRNRLPDERHATKR